ncbi:MAG: hypothetical protein WBF73_29030 [Bradyrhizobium sp.]|jgi:hypothetical protein
MRVSTSDVIASEAKQSILSLRCKMDCFASLAMTVRLFENVKSENADSKVVIAGLDPAIHPIAKSIFSDGCPDQVRA